MNDRLIGEVVGAKRSALQQVESVSCAAGTSPASPVRNSSRRNSVTAFDSASACSARSRSRVARRPWVTATLNPTANLQSGKVYTIKLTSQITDRGDNALAPTSWKATAK